MAVQPWQSCRLLEPLGARGVRARNRPIANPLQSALEPKASRSNTIKNDQKNESDQKSPPNPSPTRAIKSKTSKNPKSAFSYHGPLAGPSQATEQLSRGRPLASLQVNVLHQLQLRAWQGRLPTESAHMRPIPRTNFLYSFWTSEGVHGSCPGRRKQSHQKQDPQNTIKNHDFQMWRFGNTRSVLSVVHSRICFRIQVLPYLTVDTYSCQFTVTVWKTSQLSS